MLAELSIPDALDRKKWIELTTKLIITDRLKVVTVVDNVFFD